MGSDGIFDNLYETDILKCLRPGQDIDVQEAANCLSKKALMMSKDTNYDSPFAVSARKYGKSHPGGKEDDITVVVSKIKIS